MGFSERVQNDEPTDRPSSDNSALTLDPRGYTYDISTGCHPSYFDPRSTNDVGTYYREEELFYEPVRYHAPPPPQSYNDYYRYDYNNYYAGG